MSTTKTKIKLSVTALLTIEKWCLELVLYGAGTDEESATRDLLILISKKVNQIANRKVILQKTFAFEINAMARQAIVKKIKKLENTSLSLPRAALLCLKSIMDEFTTARHSIWVRELHEEVVNKLEASWSYEQAD